MNGVNGVIEGILHDIANNKNDIFNLGGQHAEPEATITTLLFEALRWDDVKPKSYKGLFGQKWLRTDGCRTIDDMLVIIEVKVVRQSLEYGYWHALSQGLIYSCRQQVELPGQDFLVLCIILDWGRAAGRELTGDEKRFLDQLRKDRIYFLRINMPQGYIEHNMNTNWATI